MRIFERWYFGLVSKLEIGYRVIISWRILVSYRGFFWRLYFRIVKYMNFHNSSFALRYLFNVNGKDTIWHITCFVLFCICRAEISQTCMVLHVAVLVSLESSWNVGVHWHTLRVFGATVWKLLIIASFSQWKLNKIETENGIGICVRYWCCWEAFGKSDLIEFVSQFSELRCGRN
jgi:hypothetical protein